MINYGKHTISEDDLAAVETVLGSPFLTQGPKVIEFEDSFSEKVGVAHTVSFSSATAGLHAACVALGIGPGDCVWTSPISFVASANCALYCGASIGFVDIDPISFNICPEHLESKLILAEKNNTIPKAVICVHMCGQPCDMKAIRRLSERYGFKIIEDASHATGAKYCNEPVGNCKYSDISVFSLHPVKIITSGEGGLVTTNSEKLASNLKAFRSHGITRDVKLFSNSDYVGAPWYYEQQSLGFNYRLTDIQAALGLSQLKKLKSFVTSRNEIASKYESKLSKNQKVRTPFVSPGNLSSFHLYVVQIDFTSISEKIEVFKFFAASGINLNVHYIPIHTQPYFKKLGFSGGDFPIAEAYYNRAVSIPIYPELSDQDIDRVVQLLNKVTL